MIPKTEIFLTVDHVLKLHERQITETGGEHGVRDIGLLESAVAMPKSMFGGVFLHASVYDKAAAYLFHIVKNHPFVDGNKRAGSFTATTFLRMRGLRLTCSEDVFADMVLAVAEGRLDKPSIAAFFEKNSTTK